jgi:hypothetical protein
VTLQATVTVSHIDAAGQTVSGTSGKAAGVGQFTVTGPRTRSSATLYATVQNNAIKNSAGTGDSSQRQRGRRNVECHRYREHCQCADFRKLRYPGGPGEQRPVHWDTNLQISGNTSTGGTRGGNTFPGIGLRRFGTATGEFAVVGLRPSPATNAQMESNVAGQNPGSASGTGG